MGRVFGTKANPKEPPYTTWKLRKHGTDKHTIDYIFVKNAEFEVVDFWSIPQGDEKRLALIPNWDYPSDHFAISATIQLTSY